MKLNLKDIELLIHTRCSSFYHEQINRFELIKGNKKHILKTGTFNFVDDTLSALFVFDYFHKKKLNPVLLWDLAEDGCYVISTKQNWNKYSNSINKTKKNKSKND